MTRYCTICGVLDDVGEAVICEDCADNLHKGFRLQLFERVAKGLGYSDVEVKKIVKFVGEME